MKEYIKSYMKAVYGEYADLALSTFNEKTVLTDGTLLIKNLKQALMSAKHHLKHVTPPCDHELSQCDHSVGCCNNDLDYINNVLKAIET